MRTVDVVKSKVDIASSARMPEWHAAFKKYEGSDGRVRGGVRTYEHSFLYVEGIILKLTTIFLMSYPARVFLENATVRRIRKYLDSSFGIADCFPFVSKTGAVSGFGQTLTSMNRRSKALFQETKARLQKIGEKFQLLHRLDPKLTFVVAGQVARSFMEDREVAAFFGNIKFIYICHPSPANLSNRCKIDGDLRNLGLVDLKHCSAEELRRLKMESLEEKIAKDKERAWTVSCLFPRKNS